MTETHCNCKNECELDEDVLNHTSLVETIKDIAETISKGSPNLRGLTFLFDKTALPDCAFGSVVLQNFNIEEDELMLIQEFRKIFHEEPKMLSIMEKGAALYLDDCAKEAALSAVHGLDAVVNALTQK